MSFFQPAIRLRTRSMTIARSAVLLQFRSLVAFLCLSCANHALATEVAYSESAFLEELPVVITASRLRQPLADSPNAVTVIDRDMIAASGFRTLTDIFKLVPGMYVSYYKGSQPIVSYHGSFDQYARSMQVLIDGRSVYMPPTSLVDWAALPFIVDDVERIEVIRGPAAAAYGANSVHGVINIITRDAASFDGGNVAFTHGDKGINDGQIQFGVRGEKLDYRMSLAYTTDHGYDDRTATHFPSAYGADMDNSFDDNQARLLNLRAAYYLDNRNNFDFQLGLNRDVQGVGFWDSHAQLNPFHVLNHSNAFAMLTWLQQGENGSERSVRLAHTRHVTWESLNPGNPPQPARSEVEAKTSVLTVQQTLQPGADNRLVFGVELAHDEAQSTSMFLPVTPNIHHNTARQQAVRIFVHDEWRIDQQVVGNLGGMWEDDGQGHVKLSPRGSLNFHVMTDHTLRIAGSVAYRTPSMTEKYNTPDLPYQFGDRSIVGTDAIPLQPEKIRSREIGYLGQFNQHATSLDVRIFNDQFENVIYPTSSGFANGLAGSYSGVETSLKHHFGYDTSITLNHAREYGYSNVSALSPGSADLVALSVPTNSVSVLFTQRLSRGFAYSVAYYQQGDMQPFDRGPSDHQFMHKRFDFRIAQQLKPLVGINGELSWVIQNLLNDHYTEYVASNVFDRRSYLTLKIDF